MLHVKSRLFSLIALPHDLPIETWRVHNVTIRHYAKALVRFLFNSFAVQHIMLKKNKNKNCRIGIKLKFESLQK